jgi:tRNA threonylcarbamoyladenosine biosynthesis protein TsaB
MKILGIDSSGLVASVALVEDDILVAEYTMNYKKTHSQTLLPMLNEIVSMANIDLQEIDAIAVAAGPGSFTGLRIGAATVKGLGLALDKQVIPVPTCEGLAYNLWGSDGLVCPIMDARRNQVYTGLYRVGDTLEVVLDQAAMDIRELIQIINENWTEVTFLGDGVPVFRSAIEEGLQVPYRFAPAQMNRQRAASVAALGMKYYEEGKAVLSDDFAPIYLRKSQAEREREEQLAKEQQES